MGTGFYLSAIIGAVVSFFVGCIWYTFIVGKLWQKEMNFSDEKMKEIFVPKRIILAFICEWLAAFCTIGILFNLPVGLIHKIYMLSTVVIFQGIKLSLFEGKNLKVILINEGYRLLSIIILAISYSLFM